MQTAYLVMITTPNPEVSQQVAEAILQPRLAACVNIVPGLRSLYHWQGALHSDDEQLLLAKTVQTRFEALVQAVKAAHPYENPEIIALPIVDGSPEYLAWIAAETATQAD